MNTWPATHMTNKKRSFKNNANKKCIWSLPEKDYMTFFATMIWPSNLKSLHQTHRREFLTLAFKAFSKEKKREPSIW